MNLRGTIFAVLALLSAAALGAGSSPHYSISASTLDGAGTAGASVNYSHGGHLLSPAGNGASTHYGNIVGFHAATEPEPPLGLTVNLETGDPVPGLIGATFVGATDLPGQFSGDAVLTRIKLSNGSTVGALVRPSGVLVKVGDSLATAGNAVISKLYAMSRGAFLAELKPGTGSPLATLANNKLVCFDTGAGIQVVARTGNVAPGGVTTFKLFRACTGDASGDVFFAGVLNGLRNVDTGVWVRPFGGDLKFLVKEGQSVDLGSGLKRINSITAFAFPSRSQAEGRVLYDAHSIVARLTIGSDHAIVVLPASATSSAGWIVVALAGGDAPGGIGKYLSLGLPASEDTNVAFKATLKLSSSVSAANNVIVVAGGAVIARKGSLAPGTGNVFSNFYDPAAGIPGQASFVARLAGAGSASDEGLWELRNSVVGLVARESDPAPGLGPITIRSFTRNVHPGGGLGPVFVATLNGVPSSTSTVLYGVPATGGPAVDLARTGDQFDVAGTMRTLTSLQALDAERGTGGLARGYDNSRVFMIGGVGNKHIALFALPVLP